jgi:propionate CoA-transferase
VTLTEIAPGVDLEKDVLSQMDFRPLIDPEVKLMDPRIFSQTTPMGIKNEILSKHLAETAVETVPFSTVKN